MSEDELEDWEIVEQQDAVVDKPPGDILNMDVSKADRLNGFLKNQYCRTVVEVSITSLTNLVYMYKTVQKMSSALPKMSLVQCYFN